MAHMAKTYGSALEAGVEFNTRVPTGSVFLAEVNDSVFAMLHSTASLT